MDNAVLFYLFAYLCIWTDLLFWCSTISIEIGKPLKNSTLPQLQKILKKCLFDRHLSEDSPGQTPQFCTVDIKELYNENYND
jgi:hypothetical protein